MKIFKIVFWISFLFAITYTIWFPLKLNSCNCYTLAKVVRKDEGNPRKTPFYFEYIADGETYISKNVSNVSAYIKVEVGDFIVVKYCPDMPDYVSYPCLETITRDTSLRCLDTCITNPPNEIVAIFRDILAKRKK